MDIKTKVYEYIKENEGVTYVEIQRIFEKEGFDWEGEESHTSYKFRNIVYWSGWNKAAFSVVSDLCKEGMIQHTTTSILYYQMDGACLNLPLAKSLKQYKNLRWMPTVFDIV